jgi:hypothetical protein
MAAEAKQQKLDDTPKSQTISLVWLDSSHGASVENISAQEQLRTFDANLKIFSGDNECETHIKSQSNETRIILIVDERLGEQIVPRVHDLSQIISIYVFCWDKAWHEQWAKEYPKVFVLFED